jgi:hypothetical protein
MNLSQQARNDAFFAHRDSGVMAITISDFGATCHTYMARKA